MFITVNQLANAINNLERINITDCKPEKDLSLYEVDFINEYGHIVYYEYIDASSKEQAVSLVKVNKELYSDCFIKAYKIK